MKTYRIAVLGTPNSGKTTIFNKLTGLRKKTANYPGITYDYHEGKMKGFKDICVVDVPGTYSIYSEDPDEKLSYELLSSQDKASSADLILFVLNPFSLELSLKLLLEIKRTNIPILAIVNMQSRAKSKNIFYDYKHLSKKIDLVILEEKDISKKNLESFHNSIIELINNTPNDKQKPQTLAPYSLDAFKALHREAQELVKGSRTRSHLKIEKSLKYKTDKIILHPIYGTLILVFTLFCVFQAIFYLAQYPQNYIEDLIAHLQNRVSSFVTLPQLKSLINDGILSGVGSIIIFLPQIILLYVFIFILEDTGYMPRGALLMDKFMQRIGLHGKAFIPLLSSFACAVPGIMATKSIKNRRERFTTIMVLPLITCAARLPVYTLLISAFIPQKTLFLFINQQGLVLFVLYLLGVLSAIFVAFLLKKTILNSKKSPLFLELPNYKIPSLKLMSVYLYDKCTLFIKRAGTIILSLTILMWFLCSFPKAPKGYIGSDISYSFAGMIANVLAPIFSPLGFNTEIIISLIPGLSAREVVVSTLGSIYSISDGENGSLLITKLTETISHNWHMTTGLSLLVWYVFAPQCLSTLIITKKETRSYTWPILMFSYMFILAYVFSFLTYNITKAVLT